jgi:hypothetical protein
MLEDLINANNERAERVLGTYLYPHRLFGQPDYDNPVSATKIIATASVQERQIFATRNGGLFTRIPRQFRDHHIFPGGASRGRVDQEQLGKKRGFEEDVATDFNLLVCELTLTDIVSEPASPVHLAGGRLVEGHALVVSGGGGRETYEERTLHPLYKLSSHEWVFDEPADEEKLRQACSLERAKMLSDISPELPTLVAAAYSSFSRRQLSAALNDSWVVVEQVLDAAWSTYTSGLPEAGRRGRLTDTRTYTAAVRTELLYTIGVIDSDAYEALNRARKYRNGFIHGAKIDLSATQHCMTSMRLMIEMACGMPVEPPLTRIGAMW